MIENKKSLNTNKKVHIEFLRILACFLVIVNHTNSSIFLNTKISNLWYISITYFFVSKIAVPLFLMIMGAVLLTKQDTLKKTKARVIRCINVIIIFTMINYIFKYHNQEMSILMFAKCLFGSVTNAYWYLYLYLGILLMLPVLQRIANVFTKREVEYLLILSIIIGGTVPMLSVVTDLKINSNLMAAMFSPYIGMIFAGYYIEKYLVINKKMAVLSGIIWGGTIILQVLLTAEFYVVNNSSYLQLDNRTFISIMLSAISAYIVIKYLFTVVKMPRMLVNIVLFFGSLTFGIYLLSDMAIMVLQPVFSTMQLYVGIFVAMIIYEICVFALCAIVTIVLKKMPYIKGLL